MATKKTSTSAKKTTAKKAPTARKSTAKTSTTKKTAVKKTSTPRSFRLEENRADFMKPTFTMETIYWIVLSMAVVALGFWIATLQIRINNIYDQIEVNQAQSENIEVLLKTQERLKEQAAQPASE